MFSLVCEYVICFGSVLLEKRYNFVSSKLPYYYLRTLDCDLKKLYQHFVLPYMYFINVSGGRLRRLIVYNSSNNYKPIAAHVNITSICASKDAINTL